MQGQELPQGASDITPEKDTPQTPASSPEDVKPAADPMIPKSRFDEVLQKAKTFEAKLKEIEMAESLKKGEFEKVITELKPKAERVDQLEAALAEHLETVLQDIPEEKRSLIPDGDVATRLTYINKNRSHLISKDIARQNTGAPINPTNETDKTPRQFTSEQISDPKFYAEHEQEIISWMSGGKRRHFIK